MASLPRELTTRENDRHGSELGDVIRQLASDNENIAWTALRTMARKLENYSCTFLDLAEHIENGGGGLNDDDKQKIRNEIERAHAIGYAEGVQAAEARQHGTGAFRNTDGALEWSEVALYLQRQKQRLPSKHHEFVDDMASRTVYGREPTPKQHQYLHSLFYKLGGKIA
jgi:hypothetical protein